MRPRAYVEEHRLLRGFQHYLRTGKKALLEKACTDFTRHGGDARRCDKYAALTV